MWWANLTASLVSCFSLCCRQVGGRCDLDDLLETALDRAVALVQVDDVASGVAQNLDFDVADVGHCFFEEDGVVAECAQRLTHGGVDGLGQVGWVLDTAHAAAAAASGGLDEQWKADRFTESDQVALRGQCRRLLQHRQARVLGCIACPLLVAGELERSDRWANEREASPDACFGKVGALAEEAVAGVDRVGASFFGGRNNGCRVEVCANRVAMLADLICLVGLQTMQAVAVLERVNGNRVDVELVSGPKGPNRNLATVRNKQFLHVSSVPLIVGQRFGRSPPCRAASGVVYRVVYF